MEHNPSTLQEMIFPDGVYTVLVTPFNDDDSIDYDSLTKLLDNQYQSPVSGIVLLGTTSESPTMTDPEKLEVVNFVHSYNSNSLIKKFVVVGVGGNCTKSVVDFSKSVVDKCNAFMVTVPNYNKPQQRGVVDLYQQVYTACPDKPVMIYNIPGRTGLDMEPESMIEVLKTCPNVVALKEASGNYKNVKKLVDLIKQDNLRDLTSTFKLFSGDDANAIELCENYHGRGIISVASNVIPTIMCILSGLCLNKNYFRAVKTMDIMEQFIKYLFIESNPVPIKEIMYQVGIYPSNRVRRPLMEMNDDDKRIKLKTLYLEATSHFEITTEEIDLICKFK